MERAEDFVKGLQDRGYHDIALDYLEGLKTSPLADDATRKQVPYLRGVALIEQSRQSSDPVGRNRLLDNARQELEAFAEANPENVAGAEAQLQLATVQMTRGQELVAQAAKLPKETTYDAQRRELGQEARLRFAEARDTFERAQATYEKELVKLPPTTELEARDETAGSKRQEYRARVAQLRFLAAQTQFESAQSFPPEADEFRKLNETAAQELAAIHDEFGRTLLVGLYARLYEGRCYQAVGNYPLALGCYEELLGKDNLLPPFRKLIAAALYRKAEVLIAQQKYDAAIDACTACLRDANNDEEKQTEWLAVRFCLAEALSQKSAALQADSPEARRMVAEAREAYRLVARSPGEFQTVARLASTSTPASGRAAGSRSGTADDKEEPKTFQAAYDLGKEALSTYNAARLAIPRRKRTIPRPCPSSKRK